MKVCAAVISRSSRSAAATIELHAPHKVKQKGSTGPGPGWEVQGRKG